MITEQQEHDMYVEARRLYEVYREAVFQESLRADKKKPKPFDELGMVSQAIWCVMAQDSIETKAKAVSQLNSFFVPTKEEGAIKITREVSRAVGTGREGQE